MEILSTGALETRHRFPSGFCLQDIEVNKGRSTAKWVGLFGGIAVFVLLLLLPAPSGPPGLWADGLWETPDGRRRWELGSEELEALTDPWSEIAAPVRDLLIRMA